MTGEDNQSQNAIAEDKALIEMCVDGDTAAFEQLVLRYEKKVVAAACRLCGNRHDGEDLAQEAFIKAWRALTGYRGQASFNTWMMTILTNLWKDRLRKKQLPQESIDEPAESEEGGVYRQYRDASPGPDSEAVSNEANEVLGGFISSLQPEFREALILRDVQGFSYEETAAITGSNLGTVKSRINRARTLVKAMVMEYQEQNPGFFRLTQARADKTGTKKAKGGEPREG